jgi:hypothetical protein
MPPADLHKRRRGRNLAVAGGLAVMIVLVFFSTIVKLQVLP